MLKNRKSAQDQCTIQCKASALWDTCKARYHDAVDDLSCPVKQLLSEVLPIWQRMPRPPTASDTLPPQNNNHPTTLHHVTNMQLSSQSYSAPPDLHAWCQDIQQSSAQLSNRRPLLVRSTANIPSTCHFAKLHDRNFCQGILEPFTTPGHSTATQLLQPNFHGIGRRGRRGRMLHSHGHSLQQMKQRPQNVHKRHGCVTWTKHFAFRNSETCISVRLISKQCHDMLDFKTKQCHDMLDFKTKSLSSGPYSVIERHSSKQQHRCVVSTLV